MHRSDRVLNVEELRGYLKAPPSSAPGDVAPVAVPDESERTRLGPRP
jgi:hypothetical protein